jgi:hypothetical protein
LSSEDLKTVLLALIAMIGTVAAPAVIWLLNKSRIKDNIRDAKVDDLHEKLVVADATPQALKQDMKELPKEVVKEIHKDAERDRNTPATGGG